MITKSLIGIKNKTKLSIVSQCKRGCDWDFQDRYFSIFKATAASVLWSLHMSAQHEAHIAQLVKTSE